MKSQFAFSNADTSLGQREKKEQILSMTTKFITVYSKPWETSESHKLDYQTKTTVLVFGQYGLINNNENFCHRHFIYRLHIRRIPTRECEETLVVTLHINTNNHICPYEPFHFGAGLFNRSIEILLNQKIFMQ